MTELTPYIEKYPEAFLEFSERFSEDKWDTILSLDKRGRPSHEFRLWAAGKGISMEIRDLAAISIGKRGINHLQHRISVYATGRALKFDMDGTFEAVGAAAMEKVFEILENRLNGVETQAAERLPDMFEVVSDAIDRVVIKTVNNIKEDGNKDDRQGLPHEGGDRPADKAGN